MNSTGSGAFVNTKTNLDLRLMAQLLLRMTVLQLHILVYEAVISGYDLSRTWDSDNSSVDGKGFRFNL